MIINRPTEELSLINEGKTMEREIIASSFKVSGLQTWLLDESHTSLLQDLHERCADFIHLATGRPPQLNAARDLLQELPPGKSLQDKFVLGFVRVHPGLIGVLDTVRDYPDPGTWYIGLLMIHPAGARERVRASRPSCIRTMGVMAGRSTLALDRASAECTGTHLLASGRICS